MNVLHINTSGVGGAAIAVQRLHELMLEHGIDSNILYLYDNCPHKEGYHFVPNNLKKLFRRLINHTQYLIYQKDLLANSYVFTEPTIVSAKIHKLDLFQKADVIYLHWVLGGFLNLSDFESIARTGKKIIVFQHDMWWVTGGCHHVFDCEGYKEGCLHCPRHKHLGFLTRHQAKKKRKIFSKYKNLIFVSPSKWLDGIAETSYILKGTRHCTIPNVVPEKYFKKIEKTLARYILNLPNDKFIISFGTASNKDWAKGKQFLVEALRKLNLQDILLCVYGSEGDPEISKLENVSVRYMGFLKDQTSVMLVNNASNLYISPSLAESFGQTLLENIYCGTPVVAFDCTSIPELIDHKVDGYVAKYKDSDDLVDGIKFFYEHHHDVSWTKFSTNDVYNMHYDLIKS